MVNMLHGSIRLFVHRALYYLPFVLSLMSSSKSKSRTGSRLITRRVLATSRDSSNVAHPLGQSGSRIVSHSCQLSNSSHLQRPAAEPMQRATSLNVPRVAAVPMPPPLAQRGVSADGVASLGFAMDVFFNTLSVDPHNIAQPPSHASVHSDLNVNAPTLDPVQQGYWKVIDRTGAIFRIDEYLYVLQDWDSKAEALRVRNFHTYSWALLTWAIDRNLLSSDLLT